MRCTIASVYASVRHKTPCAHKHNGRAAITPSGHL
jgi:hypothetical protein